MTPRKDPSPAALLAATLASEPGAHPIGYYAARDAETLIRLGKRALRIAEQKCNGVQRYDARARRMLASWTEGDEARADKAIARIESEAGAILSAYGATDVVASGDPRGHCLKFRLASGSSNSFASGVWGV